ncbi:MAG: N-6 DNA methylase [Oscillospiraceae bacterium]|nr:N-6 DNA methylase [Oscillospiraceae bacterium]MBO7726994.1 N-6 DNA methylase [Oscillospiraceae bacterium]
MNRIKDIIKVIDQISGRYSAYEVFTDWIRCMAMSICNTVSPIHDKVWQEREQSYMDTMRKYTPEEQVKLCEMMLWLVETLDDGPYDVLGKIYMDAGMGSKAAGQFFTPFHLSVLTAKMSLGESIESYRDEMTKLDINEPTCGGGAMIIAAAKVLQDEGINYQKVMKVVAQDLDWKGVYMCYVQLSLLGIDAICVQGNTLADPYVPGKTDRSHIMRTPKNMGVLL